MTRARLAEAYTQTRPGPLGWIGRLRLGWVLLLAIAGLAQGAGFAVPPAVTAPVALADGATTGDQALYAAIGRDMARGASYYDAAARAHRERGYPLRPFVTVRLPTLAWVTAAVGPMGMAGLALVLIATNALAWYARLRPTGLAMRFGALGLLSAFGAAGFSPEILTAHEWWSGLLLSLALAAGTGRAFVAALVLALGAALVRELAGAFLVILLGVAVLRGQGRRAAAVALTMAVLVAVMAWHWTAVSAVVRPDDAASSGWMGWRGPLGFARDLSILLEFDRAGPALATFLALSPLAGWLLAVRTVGWTPFAWFASFALGEGIAARADTFYWVQLLMPVYALGWLLLLQAVFAAAGSWRERRRAGGADAAPVL